MMSSTSFDLRLADPPVDYLERAREIAPMLAAAADEIEERRELPERIVKALIERGFFRMLLPRSLGGAELDPLTLLEALADRPPGTEAGQLLQDRTAHSQHRAHRPRDDLAPGAFRRR